MTQRWRFVTDGDGHNYIIPIEMTKDFYEKLSWGEIDYYCSFYNMFEEYLCDSVSNFTFENPEED